MKVCVMYDCVFFNDRFMLFSFCGFIDDASQDFYICQRLSLIFRWGFLHNGMVVNCPRPARSLHLAAICSMFFQPSLILDTFGQCSQSRSEKPSKTIDR